MSAILQRMSRYHIWAYETLFDALGSVSDDAYYAASPGLFGRSIHGTLAHVHLGDAVWLARLQGAEVVASGDADGTVAGSDMPINAAVVFDGAPPGPEFLASIAHLWAGKESWDAERHGAFDTRWERAVPSRAALHARTLDTARRIAAFTRELTDAKACAPFAYCNTRGEAKSGLRDVIISHIVNHGTHHRGQITTALGAVTGTWPALDLLYYAVDGA
jgi:uncharacterized damage-inducible protein DinB